MRPLRKKHSRYVAGEFSQEDAGEAHVSPVWIPRGGMHPSPGQPTPIPWAAFRGIQQTKLRAKESLL